MIILDTCIWIERLKGNKDVVTTCKEINIIATISPVFGELLQGSKSTKETERILSYWKYSHKLNENNLFIKAGLYAEENNLINKGISLIDSSIIVMTIENNAKLWTLDKKIINYLDEKYIYN